MIEWVDDQEAVKAFVQKGLGHERGFGNSTAIGWSDEKGVVAGFVYHDWNPNWRSIEISAYSSRRKWGTRQHGVQIFSYPFEQLGCRILVSKFSEYNKRVRRIWDARGATCVTIPQARSDTEDGIMSILHRDVWRKGKLARV